MISCLQIENAMEGKSGACREVFSSIVSTKSSSTKKFAIASAELYCNKVLESFTDSTSILKLKQSPIKVAASSMDFDSLFEFASAVDVQLQREAFVHQILSISTLKNMAIRFVSFMYGLDYSRLKSLRSENLDLYYEVGDAIFWAGFYLGLKNA